MKYVILEHPTKMAIVLAGCLVLHDELVAGFVQKGYRPKSAGFFRVLPSGRFQTFGFSTTLNLSPDREDERLLELLSAATLSTAPCEPDAAVAPPPLPNTYSYTTTVAKGAHTHTCTDYMTPGITTVRSESQAPSTVSPDPHAS